MNAFGNFLYSLRKEKGMTQQELADLLDVTNKAVSKWETGEAFPETAQLVPIADVFGVTVDELLRGRRAEAPMSASGAQAAAMPLPRDAQSADMPAVSDPAVWRRTRTVLAVAAAGIVIFALAYLIAACLTEGVALREVIVRGSVCLFLMALAAAGSCLLGIVLTQKLYAAAQDDARRVFSRLRWTGILGLLVLMLGVCCFVFFSLYAMPAYANNAAYVAGMTAGSAFAVAAAALFAAGGVSFLSYMRKKSRE